MINSSLYGKSVLGMDSLSAIEIDKILDIASKMKKFLFPIIRRLHIYEGNLLLICFLKIQQEHEVHLNLPASI